MDSKLYLLTKDAVLTVYNCIRGINSVMILRELIAIKKTTESLQQRDSVTLTFVMSVKWNDVIPLFTFPANQKRTDGNSDEYQYEISPIPAKSLHVSKAVRDFSLGQGAQAKA